MKVVKKGTRRWLTVAISVMYLGIAAGCAIRQPPSSAKAAPAPARQPSMEHEPPGEWVSNHYTDLPVPTGYEYKPDQSFVFVQEGLRSADLRYEGNLSVEELIRFYQESMPPNGWRFLRLTGVRMKTITFTRDGEMCEIIIMSVRQKRAEGDEWSTSSPVRTHLHIKINPY